jgi:hypothetical protein
VNNNFKKTLIIILIIFFVSLNCLPVVNSSFEKNTHSFQYHKINSIIPFPTNLEEGDLLFFDIKPFLTLFFRNISGFSNDHVIMYIGMNSKGVNMFVESNDYTISDLNTSKNGVQKTPWWIFLLYADLDTISIGKVNADCGQKSQAIQFALSVLGNHYQYSGKKYWRRYESWHANPVIIDSNNPFYEKYYYPDDPYFNQWICTELVWAAYLNQGIELDSTPYEIPDSDYNNQVFFRVNCNDILNSNNIYIVPPTWS